MQPNAQLPRIARRLQQIRYVQQIKKKNELNTESRNLKETYKYYLNLYDGNLKKSFDLTVKKLNEDWGTNEQQIRTDAENLDNAINFTIQLFGDKKSAFSKWTEGSFQGNFNRAIYDIMVYFFSIPDIREEGLGKSKLIVDAFKNLCETDPDFLTSFEHTTKSMDNTSKRYNTWGNKLAEILDTKVPVPSLNNGKFEINLV